MSRRAKVLTLAIAVLIAGLLLFRVRGILTPFYLAAAIAYVSHPLVNVLEEKQVPRSLAILLVYTMFAVFVILMVYAVLPSLTREVDQIAAFLPEQTRRLEGMTEHVFQDLQRIWVPETLQEVFNLALRRAEGLLERFASKIAELLVGILSQLFNLVLAPFLAFYLLRDGESIRKVAVSWMPGEMRRDVIELAGRIHKVVGGFVLGQLIVSGIIGLLITGGLSLLGVKYSLVVGLFAGLADIIPYFGPIIGAIPAISLALIRSPLTALWVVALMVAVQQLEGNILSPKIVGEQVGLHPLTVIFSVLAGGELAGIVGMLIAVPAAATIKVVATYAGEKVLESE